MDKSDYLDFDEAVHFLKTTPSTLYKWLQAGKIPGHKLGRQWRFLTEELELHISGKAPKIQLQREALAFAELLHSRTKDHKKEKSVETGIDQLSEKTIWDAYDHGARLIHIFPLQGKYQIRYRTREGIQQLTNIQEELFGQIDQSLQTLSSPLSDENSRRLYLQRSDEEAIQVRYQKLETVTGPRVTLRLWQPEKDILPIERIGADVSTLKTFKKWLGETHGVIIVTGSSGSGKTTTMYAFLEELKKQDRVVFTIEDPAEMVIEGVNQVELKGRGPADFEQTFSKIYSSDPDVICFGLSSYIGLEQILFVTAYRAASTGHLVLIQMDSPSCEAALEEMSKYIPYQFKHLVVGVSSQKLNRVGDKMKAEYDLLDSSEIKSKGQSDGERKKPRR
jgi:type IV pilus assembly protein PilB